MPKHQHELPAFCRWIVAGALLALVAPAAVRAENQRIALLLSSSEQYEHAKTLVGEALTRDGHQCIAIQFSPKREVPSPESSPAASGAETPERAGERLLEFKPRAVVSFGTLATTLALRALPDTPVIFCMVPNILDREGSLSPEQEQRRLAGITTDIDPAEQVGWIRRLSPVKVMGVLVSDRSRRTAQAFAEQAGKAGITVRVISASRDSFPDAITSLEDQGCKAALMIADAEVYNAASVQRLLLWGLRNRHPVWTFSPNLVKSGAFAALYADPEAIAKQTAEMVKKVLKGEDAARLGTQYPRPVLGAANLRTAELIGTPLDKGAIASLTVQYGR